MRKHTLFLLYALKRRFKYNGLVQFQKLILIFSMKIIAWNCNMAFRNKAFIVLKHKPDILVIPECEHPDKLKFINSAAAPTDMLWFGNNHNKGLGIFSYGKYKLQLIDRHNADFKMIVPVAVTGGATDVTLFAIWANNPADKKFEYVGQIWKALPHYADLFTNTRTILAGDFNSNTIWDRPSREGNHTTVVKYLEERGIHSVYHKYFNQTQGKEKHPTQYMYRHLDKPYHLDYCFASEDLISHLKKVEISKPDFWLQYSDHLPVIVTFNNL